MQNAKQEMQNAKSVLHFAFPVLHFAFSEFASRLRDHAAMLLLGMIVVSGCRKEPAARQEQNAAPQELTIAAAADLQYAMNDIAGEFRAAHPQIGVKITYGSSGNFYTQLVNHAPFDLFFSADASYPMKLAVAGLVAKDSSFPYAIGRIVLWAPKGSPFDPAARKMKGLLDPSFKRLAIANPQHAPYGRAAEAALKKYGIWNQLEPKLVQGENISQTAQFAQSGAADAGIIAMSLAESPAMKDAGTYYLIPADDYPTMEQVAVILATSKNLPAATQFKQFVQSAQGTSILKKYGFEIPKK
jgi:molybdate transport system substrate-binding protein